MARSSGGSGLLDFWPAAAGAALFLALSWSASTTKSATFDEGVHLLSGFRILTEDDYRFNHEHPPLMKMLAAAPLLMTGAARPLENWTYSGEGDQWPLAHEWLYHRNDGDRLLRLARLAIAASGALLAAVLFFAVRRAAGSGRGARAGGRTAGRAALGAGAAAVLLCAVEPNLLAHASLVTTDMGMALFFFCGAAAWWRFLESGRLSWLLASGGVWGLEMAAKFTGVILGPVFLAMGAAWILWPDPAARDRRRGRELLTLARSLAVITLVALAVLAASYGFEGIFTPLRSLHLESATFVTLAAGPLGGLPLPVPSPFVWGFDHAAAGGETWPSYLMSEYSQTGWRHYHLVALAVKSSIPLLLLAAAGLLLGGRAGASARSRWLFLLLPPALLLGAFTLLPGVKNIGLRYVLGVMPFLCALGGLGAAALWGLAPRAGKAAAVILLAAAGLSEAFTWPDHLAYFNAIAGGPEGGRRWLADSNLDWGQDLKGLGKWMKRNGVASIYLDYFGRGCPAYEGIQTEKDFEGGPIAVSVTNLVGVYRAGDRDRYQFLSGQEPVASIGHSILVWNVPRPPGWKPKPGTPSR